jgi:hypothetical protein
LSEPNNDRGPISDVTVADNTLSAPGYGVGLFDVAGGAVTGNRITLTKYKGWCGTSANPTVPVRVARSLDVTVAGNTTAGY